MDMRKDLKRLLRQAEQAGFRVDRTGRHYKVISPSGVVVGVSKTPSDRFALIRIKHDLRKAGLKD